MAPITHRYRDMIYDYSAYDLTRILLEGEIRYFYNILAGITHPCSIIGDGASKIEDLPFQGIINIEASANINLEILRQAGNRVWLNNVSGGVIQVNIGTTGVPNNYSLAIAGRKLWEFNGTNWMDFPNDIYDLTIKNDLDITHDLTVGNNANIETIVGNLDINGISRINYYLSAVQSIPDAAKTLVELDTKEFDELNEFDNVTDFDFTTTKTGYYLICALGTMTLAAGKYLYVYIDVNGTSIAIGKFHSAGGVQGSASVSKIVYLSAGDLVTLHVKQNSGGASNLAAGKEDTFMTIHKLS